MSLKFTPFPTWVRYKNLTNSGGEQKAFFVSIDPKYQHDVGLHKHEYRHVTHWWLMTLMSLVLYLYLIPSHELKYVLLAIPLFLYHILYSLIPYFRMWVEIDCYRVQIRANGHQEHVDTYVSWFAGKYGIKYDRAWIRKQLLR